MPGLVPGIHVFPWCGGEDVDGRAKSGHDGGGFESRRMGRRVPSCFETHRGAVRLRKQFRSRHAAMLLSMRAGEGGALWRSEPTSRGERGSNLRVVKTRIVF